MPNWSIWCVFGKTIACGQTLLPDMSIVDWTKVDEKCQFLKVLARFGKSQLLNGANFKSKQKQNGANFFNIENLTF